MTSQTTFTLFVREIEAVLSCYRVGVRVRVRVSVRVSVRVQRTQSKCECAELDDNIITYTYACHVRREM